MLPIIVESTDQERIQNYLLDYTREKHIPAYNVFEYSPELKEFSIREIREIILETHHHTTEPRLFHLKNFDTASLEAQNAFLKTLEEHQEQISFVLSVEHATRLLPTIRSRSKIITLKNARGEHEDGKIDLLLKHESSPIRFFAKSSNTIAKSDIPKKLQSLITHYRSRLHIDQSAPSILKKIMYQQNLMRYNNLDPQTAIDSVILTVLDIERNGRSQ